MSQIDVTALLFGESFLGGNPAFFVGLDLEASPLPDSNLDADMGQDFAVSSAWFADSSFSADLMGVVPFTGAFLSDSSVSAALSEQFPIDSVTGILVADSSVSAALNEMLSATGALVANSVITASIPSPIGITSTVLANSIFFGTLDVARAPAKTPPPKADLAPVSLPLRVVPPPQFRPRLSISSRKPRI
jgi:hypothetical protein